MKDSLVEKSLTCVVVVWLVSLFFLGITGYGVNISNIEFELKSRPGTSTTREIIVSNDENKPIDITVETGDWYRKLNGANRFMGKNAARWQAPGYGLAAGETLTITYRASVEEGFEGKFRINGEVEVSQPDSEVNVYGDSGYDLANGRVLTERGEGEGPISVQRSVEVSSGSSGGLGLKVTVEITANDDVRGITLSEMFPVNTKITNIKSAGIPIEYVSRSAADWIDLSSSEFSLDPGESRNVEFSVSPPPGIEGTHWAAIYVRSRPVSQDREGTTIVAIKRFAVKVYVTPPGQNEKKAFVTDFSAITRSIPKFRLSIANEGQVELGISGELRLRDEKGEVVDTIEIKSFELLPGYSRKLVIQGEETTNLSPGKYNALAVLDYGGENKIGKSISFRVNQLNLQPIGASPSLPKDLDGDGLYEDIDGSGSLEKIDALVFSFNYDKNYIQENGRAFDFNLDGAVNLKDAEKLMSVVQSG